MALRRPPTTFSDEINAADLAANSVTASELADDAVDTAAIADGAVDADRLAANAVTTAKILNANVTTDKVADGNITTAKVADSAVTSAKVATATFTDNIEVKPHIIPGVLYPGVLDKQLDGTTALAASTTGPAGSTIASSKYGTVQSDGRMYYYTDIKGSKPIKDPRIGAYFGSQRHMLKSIQKLEEESGAQGGEVYTVDGREWMRCAGMSNGWEILDGSSGLSVNCTDASAATAYDGTSFIEVVGYFNKMNWGAYTNSDHANQISIYVNGTDTTNDLSFETTQHTPLRERYSDANSLKEVNVGTIALGINTVKLMIDDSGSAWNLNYCCELIAQDTQNFTATNATNILTSAGHTLSNGDQIRLTGGDLPNGLNATTTYYVIGVSGNNFQVSTSSGGAAVTFSDDGSGTRTFTALNNIQIQPQKVVSYGKKFTISPTAQHYNPFNGMTGANNLAALGNFIDTATSLGMENWKAGTANYYKPFQGGRVVRWIDSSGAIKTSVTMMPPNAQNIGTEAHNTISNAHIQAGTNDDIVNFDTTTIANSTPLHEVAKEFLFREFGHGAANQGAGGTLADGSMLKDAQDDFGYFMDDGCTGISGYQIQSSTSASGQPGASTANAFIGYTFIGTGFGFKNSGGDHKTVAQNLPYGSHMYKGTWTSDSTKMYIDGSEVEAGVNGIERDYLYIYQPKRPPIPEDACIISDYMLMADHVKIPAAGVLENGIISKGVRMISALKDLHYDNSSGAFSQFSSHGVSSGNLMGHRIHNGNGNSVGTLPFFGTTFMFWGEGHSSNLYNSWSATLAGSAANITHVNNTGSLLTGHGDIGTSTTVNALGRTSVALTFPTAYNLYGVGVVTPIHTSSHYQPFENPFTKQLIGGDRNMEQTNLVVTADGKTWDEVTRDTSYIGNNCVFACRDGSTITSAARVFFDTWRGLGHNSKGHYYNKDFAIASEKIVCLVEGNYKINVNGVNSRTGGTGYYIIRINGSTWIQSELGFSSGAYESNSLEADIYLQKNDNIYIYASYFKAAAKFENSISITRL